MAQILEVFFIAFLMLLIIGGSGVFRDYLYNRRVRIERMVDGAPKPIR